MGRILFLSVIIVTTPTVHGLTYVPSSGHRVGWERWDVTKEDAEGGKPAHQSDQGGSGIVRADPEVQQGKGVTLASSLQEAALRKLLKFELLVTALRGLYTARGWQVKILP